MDSAIQWSDGTRVLVLAVEQPRAEALDLGEVAARNLILGRDLREGCRLARPHRAQRMVCYARVARIL